MLKSIVELLFKNSYEKPNKIAITDGKKSWSYADLRSNVLKVSRLLAYSYKLIEGDKVILAADKQFSFVAVYFACHLLGIVALPIAHDTNQERFRLIKDKIKPQLIIGFKNIEPDIDIISFSEVDKYIEKDNFTDFSPIKFPSLNTIADIIFTTGTTGLPKGVQLTQCNIASSARNINSFIGNLSDDIELLALPIAHSFGLGRLRCALSNGQTVLILGSFANIKRFYRYIDLYKVTGFGMVPASWEMLKKMSGTRLADYAGQLKYIEIGSAPMRYEDKKLLMDILPNTRICMHYGLTEASRSTFIEFHADYNKLHSIGKPSPNTNVKIFNELGMEVSTGVEGEICVSGQHVTPGYYNLPQDNEKSFYHEYFKTGDWGKIESDGYVYLSSRKKELINVGGKKVSPIEVEEFIQQIDFIQDCACIGIPDQTGVLGEVVKAYLVTSCKDSNIDENINNILRPILEGYKIPVTYEIIDVIPRTSNGKIQRLLLKERSQK